MYRYILEVFSEFQKCLISIGIFLTNFQNILKIIKKQAPCGCLLKKQPVKFVQNMAIWPKFESFSSLLLYIFGILSHQFRNFQTGVPYRVLKNWYTLFYLHLTHSTKLVKSCSMNASTTSSAASPPT